MAKKKKRRGGARPGAGRPRIYADLQKVTISLPADLLARLDEYGRRYDLSRAGAARRLLGRLLR